MTIAEYNLCVEKFADNVYRFALKNLNNTDEAKDVVQDSYEKLWIKYDTIDYSKAKSYLFSVAYHKTIDIIRRVKKSIELTDDISVTDINFENSANLREILEMAIKKLPEIQRSALLLRDYEGYTYKEIEEIMLLTESQVKVYIYRARKFLMNYIRSIENVV